MKVLVANVGSTSYKCRLIDMNTEEELASGAVEKVYSEDAIVSYSHKGKKVVDKEVMPIADHAAAVVKVLDYMSAGEGKAVSSYDEIDAVGFKTVQAGPKNGSVLLTKDVTDAMEEYASLFPAHNPPYLKCIYHFQKIMPTTPLVGVFEPGFHTGVPEYARVFGVPYEWYEKYSVKKYGYHGASFRFVTNAVIDRLKLDRNNVKMIACHMGGSSSICAYKDGESIDVSMSFTSQSGFIQSARTGDIDPFVVPFVMEKTGKSMEEVFEYLGKKGGLLGISGVSSDIRDVEEAAEKGNKRARLAIDKLVYDAVRYIGSYYALLGGLDVIAFSGGIGMYDSYVRGRILEQISFLGIELDAEKHESRAEGLKTKDSSKIKVITVDTNEEIVVARETVKVVENK